MPSSPSPAPRRVYHISWPRLLPFPLLGLGLFVLFASALLPTASNKMTWSAYLLVLGVVVVFFGAGFLLCWQSRLVLTPEGIEHHQIGYTIRSTWGNIQAISIGRGRQAALFLAEPGTRSRLLKVSTVIAGGAYPGLFSHSDALGTGRLITLFPFMYHWNKGTLREDLRRWAPHLFDANGTPKSV